MIAGILAVAAKELRHMLHDRLTLSLTLGLPVLQLLMYGYALETRVRNVPAALLNLDTHEAGRVLARRLERSPLFDLQTSYRSREELTAAMRRGAIRAAVEIPPDYSASLLYLRKPTIRVWVDGADAATSNLLLAAFDSLGFEASAAQARSRPATGFEPGVRVESHVLANAAGGASAYLIPGLITILVQTIVALLMGLSIASERERGTLEQLLVTPIGRDTIILGKAAAVVAIGLVECAVLGLLMRYLFAIPVAGSLLLLAGIVPLLVLLPLGLGLLIAAAARNHSHAIQMGNLILTPSILLSGFVFPREFLHFPFDEISRVLPTTYFVSLSRDIILRGTPAADLVASIAWTAGLAALLLTVGFLALRRSLAAPNDRRLAAPSAAGR
jgi:ABC-2 type transport system permease protein